MLLKNKTAFITGSASGIGLHIAQVFAQQGANVVIADLKSDAAEATAMSLKEKGHQALGVAVVSAPTTTVTGTVAVSGTPLMVSQDNLFYNESVTAQAASATLTGTSRDVGVAAAAAHRYAAFNAYSFSDQAGVLRIECSNDNVTWRRMTADVAAAANTPVILSVPVMTRYHRAVYVNGATAQTAFILNTSLTAA